MVDYYALYEAISKLVDTEIQYTLEIKVRGS